MTRELRQIVRDIRTLATDLDRRWHKNLVPMGIAANAQRIATTVDMAALRRCIDFIVNEPPSEGLRGYRAACRLRALLQIIERHRTDIERHLHAA